MSEQQDPENKEQVPPLVPKALNADPGRKDEQDSADGLDGCIEGSRRWWGRRSRRLRFSDAIQIAIFFAAIVYGFLTYRLWRTAEESMRTGQRAYLLIDGVRLTDPVALNSRLRLEWVIRHTGQTPAKNIRTYDTLYIAPDARPLPEPSGLAPSVVSRGAGQVLRSPDAPSVWFEDIDGRTTTAEDIARITPPPGQPPRERLWVQVVVWYETVFGQPARTTLCAYWEGSALTSCGFGNDIE